MYKNIKSFLNIFGKIQNLDPLVIVYLVSIMIKIVSPTIVTSNM